VCYDKCLEDERENYQNCSMLCCVEQRYGPRSFRVAAPFVWNNLPRHLRNDDISREQFARDLKTVLFARAYSSEAPLRTSV